MNQSIDPEIARLLAKQRNEKEAEAEREKILDDSLRRCTPARQEIERLFSEKTDDAVKVTWKVLGNIDLKVIVVASFSSSLGTIVDTFDERTEVTVINEGREVMGTWTDYVEHRNTKYSQFGIVDGNCEILRCNSYGQQFARVTTFPSAAAMFQAMLAHALRQLKSK